ncbi:MAG: NUDIX domain-containing protein [Anaerolineae bacterium]|nr:NUDIX domain-containing protein [Anaerolineae bacterium]
MTLVACRTWYNETKHVPAESLIVRPSAYGLVLGDGRLLVAQTMTTGKLVLPGGGADPGERLEATLRREVWEETGIEVEVGDFLHFHEDFFYYDPLDLAMHGYLFYYACRPLTTSLNPPEYPPEEDLSRPLWADVTDLRAESFQTHGDVTMRLLERLT